MSNPCEFLTFAGGIGLSIVAGVLFSFLVEVWPWFASLTGKKKRYAFGVLSLVLGAAVTALSYIPGLGCTPLGWWGVLMAVVDAFMAFGGGTLAHSRKL